MNGVGNMAAAALLADLPAAPAHILHIGAGQALALDAYLASGAARVTLVEADPDIAAALAARVGDDDRLRVICAAISATEGTRPFHRTNLPDLNAFHAPDKAPALFPGLRMLSSAPLSAMLPTDLLNSLDGPAQDGPQLLVIEAFGEALGILQALARADMLSRFDRVRVQEARDTLYSGIPPLDAVQAALVEAGFVTAPDQRTDDPDLPVLIARMDADERLHQQIARLTAERDHAHARIDSLRQERDDAQQRANSGNTPQELQMAQYRLAQGREEMLRLEGQLRLIRELLLNKVGS